MLFDPFPPLINVDLQYFARAEIILIQQTTLHVQGGGGQCRYNVLHVLAAAPLAYWQYFLHQQNQVFIFFTNQVFIFPTRPTTITTTTECKMFTSSCVIHTPLSSTPHVQFVVLVRSPDGRISMHECKKGDQIAHPTQNSIKGRAKGNFSGCGGQVDFKM